MAFLNKQQQEQVIAITTMIDYLRQTGKEWEEHDQDDKQIRYIKQSASLLQNQVVDRIMEPLDDDQVETVVKKADKMAVQCSYTDQALRKRNKLMRSEEVTPVETEDLYDIADIALCQCSRCKKDKKAAGKCKLKRILLEYDVPVYNADNDVCPYQ